jgi:hypothetical protein
MITRLSHPRFRNTACTCGALIAAVIIVITSYAAARSPVPVPASKSTATTFGYVDIYLDPHNKSLAAYQLELVIPDQAATVVGIEGGDAAAFKAPPYYDPAAMSQSRVILAAFSTGADLPKAKTRVARVHLRFDKPNREYSAKLMTAATQDGNKIAADASVSEGAQP